MAPHSKLFEIYGMPVIVYDQIGNGQSTHLPHKPKSFWQPKIFVDELENLVEKLGIAGNFDLLGHSWGALLGSAYVGERRPKGLRRLILANGPASVPLVEKGINDLLDRFPPEVRQTIEKHEREGTTDHPDFKKATHAFAAKHICQLDPWPQPLLDSFAANEKDGTVYAAMNGPKEFVCLGTLKDFSSIPFLPNITCPTLLLNGVDDEVVDDALRPFFKYIPKVRWFQFSYSHLAIFEVPEKYFKVVGEFLTEG